MELIFRIKTTKETIFNFLTQIDKFVSVHQLIYKMTPLDNNSFKIYEKVKFGFIPCKFTYNTFITSLESDTVRIMANVAGITRIELIFKLNAIDSETIITEQISVTSLLPVKKYMYSLFRNQHQIMFQNIEKLSS